MNLKDFAEQWASSWNSKNVDNVLALFSDEIQITSPMGGARNTSRVESFFGKAEAVKYSRWMIESGRLSHFRLVEAMEGSYSVAVLYEAQRMRRRAIDIIYFNTEGRITKLITHCSGCCLFDPDRRKPKSI